MKAASSAGTLEAAKEPNNHTLHCDGSLSDIISFFRGWHNRKEKIFMEIKKISDYLPTGEAYPISMKELSKRLGASERETRAIILAERRQGVPICSDCKKGGGYYLPANSNEAKTYFRQQTARINSAQAALNGVVRYLKECAEEED